MFRPFSANLSNELMVTTLHGAPEEPEERVRQLHRLGGKIGSTLGNGWMENPHGTSPTLHNLMAYSALPCLVNLVREEPHTIATALKVTGNLSKHCSAIINGPLGDINEISRRLDREYVIGSLSELAIFGTMWWSIANHIYTPDSYAIPTTSDEDRGSYHDSKSNGYDIGLIERQADLQKIQVKTGQVNQAVREVYEPDIAIISPVDIIGSSPYHAPLLIIDALAHEDKGMMRQAAQAAKRIIRHTQGRPEYYVRTGTARAANAEGLS